MTVITQVPLYSEEIYRYSVVLVGQVRYIRFYYNSRTKLWHMDIDNEGNTPIIKGVALVPNFPIMQDYAIPGWEGHFWLFPKTSTVDVDIKSSRFAIAEHFELYHYHVPQGE